MEKLFLGLIQSGCSTKIAENDTFLGLTSNGWIAVATMVIAIMTFLAAVVAVKNSKLLFSLRIKDEWLKSYKEHYIHFWNDKDLRKVRLWITNDQSYENKLLPVLKKRLENEREITEEEYVVIDILDKFINMIMLIRQINPKLKQEDDIWEELMLSYWQTAPIRKERVELQEYIKVCYKKTFYVNMNQTWKKIS